MPPNGEGTSSIMWKFTFILVGWAMTHLLCAMADGFFIGEVNGSFVSWVNNMLGFQVIAEGGFNLVTTPISWITDGFTKLILWDYAVFDGGFWIFRLLLILVSIGVFLGTVLGRVLEGR